MVIVKTSYKFMAYPSKEQKSILNYPTTKDDNTTVEATRKWLRDHGLGDVKLNILYPWQDRSEMDFRFYIDDNPGLVEKITSKDGKVLFLVRTPTNSHISEEGPKVIRVADINYAIDLPIHTAITLQKPRRIKGV